MAKIAKLPNQAIIDGFKGKVDYYVYMGVPCARAWPRSPGHARAPLVELRWLAFTWASSNWSSLSPEVQEAYKLGAMGTHLSGRDLFTKTFLESAYVRLE